MARNIEEPRFEVEGHAGDVEIRRYAPLIRASTVVEGDHRKALNEGFRRIAGYIFGGNRAQEKIAMTAPVAEQPTRIAMTAPVSTSNNRGEERVVSFVMPAAWTLDTLPIPNDPRVSLHREPEQRVAALRFSGLAGDGTFERLSTHVLEQLHDVGETPAAAPTLARYNPPWTLPFLRRNEILVPLAAKAPR